MRGIPYSGGKQRLSNWIISHFPRNYKYLHYIEPFVGGGGVFFKKEKSTLESLNDLDSSLINLYIQLRENYQPLKEKLDLTLYSEEEFKKAEKLLKNPERASELEWARCKFFILISSFGAGGVGFGFGYSKSGKRPCGPVAKNKIDLIPDMSNRLKDAQIFNRDAIELIKKVDGKDSLFYLDPPYPETDQRKYNKECQFSNEKFNELIDVLKNIKGKFLLSFYKKDYINYFPYHWNLIQKEIPLLTLKEINNPRQKRTESLIRNFKEENFL